MTGGPDQTALICRVCGTDNPPTRQFCRRCAADLRAPVPVRVVASAPPPERSRTAPILLGGGLALLAVLVLGGMVFFLNSGGTSASPSPAPLASATAAPGTSPSVAPTAAPDTAEPTDAPEPTPDSTPRPPRIRHFIAPDAVPCEEPTHSGFIIVNWAVRNATGATISIDGPGIYEEYEGRQGRVELPFTCEGPHTYLLTTVGGVGPPAQREVRVVPEYPATPSPSGL